VKFKYDFTIVIHLIIIFKNIFFNIFIMLEFLVQRTLLIFSIISFLCLRFKDITIFHVIMRLKGELRFKMKLKAYVINFIEIT